jgi:purine-nucleoside phosphorylase
MQGRVHYYEGYPITDVVLPVRLMAKLGAKYLFLTNASGGINRDFKAGDFMMLTDHISLFAHNPLIGPNIDEIGTRFPDMSSVYDPILQDIIMSVADDFDIEIQKGVYAQVTGPSFESPAEIRMLSKLGVDAVGMSTVVEAIAANHMGMKICAISCVCNLAAGISETPLTHDEVQEAAAKAAPLFKQILRESITRIGAL